MFQSEDFILSTESFWLLRFLLEHLQSVFFVKTYLIRIRSERIDSVFSYWMGWTGLMSMLECHQCKQSFQSIVPTELVGKISLLSDCVRLLRLTYSSVTHFSCNGCGCVRFSLISIRGADSSVFAYSSSAEGSNTVHPAVCAFTRTQCR